MHYKFKNRFSANTLCYTVFIHYKIKFSSLINWNISCCNKIYLFEIFVEGGDGWVVSSLVVFLAGY